MECPLQIFNFFYSRYFCPAVGKCLCLLSHLTHAGDIDFVLYIHVCEFLPLQEKPTICFQRGHSVTHW